MDSIYHTTKPILHNTLPPYRDGVCPVCQKPVSVSTLGAGSHLRSHVRRGEMSRADFNAHLNGILGRTYKGEK